MLPYLMEDDLFRNCREGLEGFVDSMKVFSSFF